MPPAVMASNATIVRIFRLRRKASGNNTNPAIVGAAHQPDMHEPAFCTGFADPPVVTCTAIFPGALPVTISLAGLKVQTAFAGKVPHANVKVPEDPPRAVNTKVKLAVCPLETVWLGAPRRDTVKSNPIPESPACAPVARALLVHVRFPVCCPAIPGLKVTAAAQLAPIGSVEVQVVLVNPKLLETLTARSLKATGPVFVTVTVCTPLAVPTPVVGKVKSEGCNCNAPAAPPIPFRMTVAAFTEEAIVNAPAEAPFVVGV